jgi:hypothetical protein
MAYVKFVTYMYVYITHICVCFHVHVCYLAHMCFFLTNTSHFICGLRYEKFISVVICALLLLSQLICHFMNMYITLLCSMTFELSHLCMLFHHFHCHCNVCAHLYGTSLPSFLHFCLFPMLICHFINICISLLYAMLLEMSHLCMFFNHNHFTSYVTAYLIVTNAPKFQQ